MQKRPFWCKYHFFQLKIGDIKLKCCFSTHSGPPSPPTNNVFSNAKIPLYLLTFSVYSMVLRIFISSVHNSVILSIFTFNIFFQMVIFQNKLKVEDNPPLLPFTKTPLHCIFYYIWMKKSLFKKYCERHKIHWHRRRNTVMLLMG